VTGECGSPIGRNGGATTRRAKTVATKSLSRRLYECTAALRAKYPDCIVMSARRPDEVASLRQTIVAFFQKDLVEDELFLSWSAQQLRGEIYASCEVLEERADEEGAFFRVRCEGSVLQRLREQFAQLS
jgi:GTP-binding protein HflX